MFGTTATGDGAAASLDKGAIVAFENESCGCFSLFLCVPKAPQCLHSLHVLFTLAAEWLLSIVKERGAAMAPRMKFCSEYFEVQRKREADEREAKRVARQVTPPQGAHNAL